MMKEIEGDLIKMAQTGHFDVIVHGCNCFCQMGAGIAKDIRDQCREAYVADRMTIPSDKSKLGTITYAEISKGNYVCVNAYTQFGYTRGDTVDVDYDALSRCFQEIKKTFTGKRIGIPLIGAGLAGGDWTVISAIINEVMEDEDITLVRYNPDL